LLAGVVEYAAGWRALNLAVLPLLCGVGLALVQRMRTLRGHACAPG